MLQPQAFLPSNSLGAGQVPPLGRAGGSGGDRPLRHYLVGTPAAAQHAIDRLHLLGYLERISWSPTIAISPSGLILHPEAGEILRYSQRDGRSLAR